MSWEVLHFTVCDGWVNTWTVNDKPETFKTRKAAEAAIDEFLADTQAEIDCGDRDPEDGYSRAEFAAVRVLPSGPRVPR